LYFVFRTPGTEHTNDHLDTTGSGNLSQNLTRPHFQTFHPLRYVVKLQLTRPFMQLPRSARSRMTADVRQKYMRDSFPVTNPWLRMLISLLAVLLAVAIIFLTRWNMVVALACVAIILSTIATSHGLQKKISLEGQFVVVHYILGSLRYPIHDIVALRDHSQRSHWLHWYHGNRVDIVTQSGRAISLYPRKPDVLINRLQKEWAERAGAANPHAFGTSGISPAEQARMPEASGDT